MALAALAIPAVGRNRSIYQSVDGPHIQTISIIAISSSIHQGAGNQEVYLAVLTAAKSEHQLVKLVDAYPSYGTPIPRSTLRTQPQLLMRLRRDPECDVTGKAFFLPPGDMNLFDSTSREQLAQHDAEILPCFQVEHQFTRLKE